eukprot:3308829-Amphidinium_carterae.1
MSKPLSLYVLLICAPVLAALSLVAGPKGTCLLLEVVADAPRSNVHDITPTPHYCPQVSTFRCLLQAWIKSRHSDQMLLLLQQLHQTLCSNSVCVDCWFYSTSLKDRKTLAESSLIPFAELAGCC